MLHEKDLNVLCNWIELTKRGEKITILDGIQSLQDYYRMLESMGLELCIDDTSKIGEGTFYVVNQYSIKKYYGYIVEKDGNVQISKWDFLKTIPYSLKSNDCKYPVDIVLDDMKEEAYIINAMSFDNIMYYQEKDENGLYDRNLETTNYLVIRNCHHKEKSVEKVYQLF